LQYVFACHVQDRCGFSRYVLLAIDDSRGLVYRDPSVIKPYFKGGQMIHVPGPIGAQLTVNVQTRKK
jgi:hypothetical protein